MSVDRKDGRTSVVISARLSGAKQTMLVTWFVAWLICGLYVMYARTRLPEGDVARQYFLVFLAFWAYFAVLVGKAVLWRLKGFELWRVKDGTLTVKDSLFGYGKATSYFVDNIHGMGLLNIDPRSWKWQLNQSGWVIGGERLGFEHMGRKVVFGKGLSEEEARRLVPLLKRALTEQRAKPATGC
ncbi:MAG: hypothetical protein KDC00_10265 [Flavobacteriales bacterium]|nr:hypothetical protein [Flavobacteriales bacterium]